MKNDVHHFSSSHSSRTMNAYHFEVAENDRTVI